MTPLNTIIEEEKDVLGEKLYCALTEVIPKMQVVVSIGDGEDADICDLEEILPELLDRTLQPLLTTAIQRAYEAGEKAEREIAGKTTITWEDENDELYTYFGKCECGASCVIVGSKYCSECGKRITNPLRKNTNQDKK